MNPKNNGRSSRIRRLPQHPFIFASYPILALLVTNLSEINPAVAVRSLVISIFVAIALILIFYLILHDWRQAALFSSFILILFYSYGHIYILLKGISLQGVYVFRHRSLIPILAGGTFLILWWVLRKPTRSLITTTILNVTGTFLLLGSLSQLTYSLLQTRSSETEVGEGIQALDLKVGDDAPDIYYIILDGYGRSDVLKSDYQYNNSNFLNALRDVGFYVADCSQSNYAQTQLSVSSSLNFDYIDALTNRFTAGMDDRTGLDALIKHNIARQSLEKAGYKTVAFATGFLLSEWYDADYYLAPESDMGELNEFEHLLLQTTLVRTIQDGRQLGFEDTGSELFRRRTLFALDKLDKLSYIKEPKFVFVHLIVPHPPYVFGPKGGPVSLEETGTTRSENNAKRYRDQVIFISNQMKEILPGIIATSARPPIIVLQSDHGPPIAGSPIKRMKNLSAYYVPGVNMALYPTITPVNSFRMIFNAYFDQNLPLLDDVSFYSNYDDPFQYKVIPNTCKANP